MEEQTWNNAQKNTEKEKLTDIKTYCKASVIKTLVLAYEKTNRPVEQNRKPRNRPKYIMYKKVVAQMTWVKTNF